MAQITSKAKSPDQFESPINPGFDEAFGEVGNEITLPIIDVDLPPTGGNLEGMSSEALRDAFAKRLTALVQESVSDLGIEIIQQELARCASTVCDSAHAKGMDASASSESTSLEVPSLTAISLEKMTLKKRREALTTHYATTLREKSWTQVKKAEPLPEEFVAWADVVFPDRRALRLRLSDLRHLDKAAYEKLMNWKRAKKQIPEDNFGFPSVEYIYDQILADEGAPTAAEVFESYRRGDPNATLLNRRYTVARNRSVPTP